MHAAIRAANAIVQHQERRRPLLRIVTIGKQKAKISVLASRLPLSAQQTRDHKKVWSQACWQPLLIDNAALAAGRRQVTPGSQ
jgi:hypothetical protein